MGLRLRVGDEVKKELGSRVPRLIRYAKLNEARVRLQLKTICMTRNESVEYIDELS